MNFLGRSSQVVRRDCLHSAVNSQPSTLNSQSQRMLLILSIFFLFAISFTFAQSTLSEPTVCCEKTIPSEGSSEGAWCQNVPEDQCAEGFQSAPTSCESASYCKTGTCYDSNEGLCTDKVPKQVCDNSGGTWDSRDIEEVPQCQLGCCLIADQSAFVSLVRCKGLSTTFGVDMNYLTNVNNEASCIALSQSQDKGACVYEKEFERVCEFTTREDCGAVETIETITNESGEVEISTSKTFYEDYLCSAEELATVCAKQVEKKCYNGKTYYFDSCGNPENVYSSDSAESWKNGRSVEPEEVCDPTGEDSDCGNCDYLQGARCGDVRGEAQCKTTTCKDTAIGEAMNGEAWCVNDPSGSGLGTDSVGSRYLRQVCREGEVITEPCAEFRNEICVEGAVEIEATGDDFSTSICRVNRWQDCLFQTDDDDCLNGDKRDCMWESSVPVGFAASSSDGSSESESSRSGGICLPKFTPGLKFWEDSSAPAICSQASASCQVKYEKGLLDNEWKVVENPECLTDTWAIDANAICASLGDCGVYTNYQGAITNDGYEWKINGNKKDISDKTISQYILGATSG